jgi:Flp pilus assembly pilin Flp
MHKLETFLAIESEVTPIEYALIASLTAVCIVLAYELFGAQVGDVLNEIGATVM